VRGILQYVHARIAAEASKPHPVDHNVDSDIGYFMNLHCGHNNSFSVEEQEQLKRLLEMALSRDEAQSSQLHNGSASSAQISIV
jgi:hypothetical protein